MKRIKDFRYYGEKRFKVKRILRALDFYSKHDYSLFYIVVSFVLVALCINLQKIFNVDLGIVGGVLSTICIAQLIWCLCNVVTYFVCSYLDKYYWRKRVELFNKYLDEKKENTRTRNNTNK